MQRDKQNIWSLLQSIQKKEKFDGFRKGSRTLGLSLSWYFWLMFGILMIKSSLLYLGLFPGGDPFWLVFYVELLLSGETLKLLGGYSKAEIPTLLSILCFCSGVFVFHICKSRGNLFLASEIKLSYLFFNFRRWSAREIPSRRKLAQSPFSRHKIFINYLGFSIYYPRYIFSWIIFLIDPAIIVNYLFLLKNLASSGSTQSGECRSWKEWRR